ncbi:unnamed protein product [Chironomus riparius]|uniref:Uncharacterized protein n=1 Tax=Chironomus riparius TaxID=315576 RepID=A0A9N9RUM7_9DIPT|nr:unnamed protein product [Chironomus riparius]
MLRQCYLSMDKSFLQEYYVISKAHPKVSVLLAWNHAKSANKSFRFSMVHNCKVPKIHCLLSSLMVDRRRRITSRVPIQMHEHGAKFQKAFPSLMIQACNKMELVLMLVHILVFQLMDVMVHHPLEASLCLDMFPVT